MNENKIKPRTFFINYCIYLTFMSANNKYTNNIYSLFIVFNQTKKYIILYRNYDIVKFIQMINP